MTFQSELKNRDNTLRREQKNMVLMKKFDRCFVQYLGFGINLLVNL